MGIRQHGPQLMMRPLTFLCRDAGVIIIRPVAQIFPGDIAQAVDRSGNRFFIGIRIVIFDGILRLLELSQVGFKIGFGGDRAVGVNGPIRVNFQRGLILALPLFELCHEVLFCHSAEFSRCLIRQGFDAAGWGLRSILGKRHLIVVGRSSSFIFLLLRVSKADSTDRRNLTGHRVQ